MAKKTTKKPARRFVVGYERGWCVWGDSSSVYGTVPVTIGRATKMAAGAKITDKIIQPKKTIYELVPVAGGRTNAKR